MEFDKEIKAKVLTDEYVICHFDEVPYYMTINGTFLAAIVNRFTRWFSSEAEAQAVCKERNEELAEDGHPLAGKIRVCRLALQVLPNRDVAGDEESAHFTPRKKVSQICPAHFDEVSPEDLMDDFEPPSPDQTEEFKEPVDVEPSFGCGEE